MHLKGTKQPCLLIPCPSNIWNCQAHHLLTTKLDFSLIKYKDAKIGRCFQLTQALNLFWQTHNSIWSRRTQDNSLVWPLWREENPFKCQVITQKGSSLKMTCTFYTSFIVSMTNICNVGEHFEGVSTSIFPRLIHLYYVLNNIYTWYDNAVEEVPYLFPFHSKKKVFN